jgi:DNA modification methylase
MAAKGKSRSAQRPPVARPPSLLDTRIVYCGDCLDQLRKLPNACVNLSYIDPPFNSNRNYEVFWGEVLELRAQASGFFLHFESTQRLFLAAFAFSFDAEKELANLHKHTGRVINFLTLEAIPDEEHVQKL